MAVRSGGVKMKDWSSDKIIAVGITLSLILIIVGADIVAVSSGDMSIMVLGKELVIGLFGYMGRGAVQSMSSQNTTNNTTNNPTNPTSEALSKVAQTASDAKAVVDAVDTLNNTLKKK